MSSYCHYWRALSTLRSPASVENDWGELRPPWQLQDWLVA
jgi:hypothetical protein